MTTKIEWTDITVNPVVGCSKCSPGCDNCYAERFAARLAKNPLTAAKYACVVDAAGKWTGKTSDLNLSLFDKLPKKPQRVFVGSMTDIFHPNIYDNDGQGMREMFKAMWEWPQHTFILLTKRPENMKSDIDWIVAQDGDLPENLWLGVTVCNQAEADAKIPVLLETPAAKRFVSVEPMLAPVEIGKYLYGSYECGLSCGTRLPCTTPPEKRCSKCGFTGPDDYETWGKGDCEECPECGQSGCCGEIEEACPECGHYMVKEHIDTQYIDWVICGGETGPGARPMHPDWARGLRDQCAAAGVPFFFKGWGEWWPGEKGRLYRERTISYTDGQDMILTGKRRAGRLLDGVEHNAFPEAHP